MQWRRRAPVFAAAKAPQSYHERAWSHGGLPTPERAVATSAYLTDVTAGDASSVARRENDSAPSAGALAAEMQAEAQALAAANGGQVPRWLRYVDVEQE